MVPPLVMVVGLKALVSVGNSGVTITQLLVTPLVTLVVPLMLPLPLVKAAGLLAQLLLVLPRTLVMATVMVQLAAPAGTLTSLTTILPLPAVAVTTPAVPTLLQVPLMAGVAATLRLAGSVSVKLDVVAGEPVGLVSVKVSVVVPPLVMVVGLKLLVRVGGAAFRQEAFPKKKFTILVLTDPAQVPSGSRPSYQIFMSPNSTRNPPVPGFW